MRTNCTARRSYLTLEETENKLVIVIDMTCPNEMKKKEKRANQEMSITMLRNTRTKKRLYFENDTIMTGCFGGGMKQLKRFERTVR